MKENDSYLEENQLVEWHRDDGISRKNVKTAVITIFKINKGLK